jgi:hypothetical protein
MSDDDISTIFYMRVGECVTAWAEVEDELFRIFRYCVGPLKQCAIIYYRTPGLEVRFGLADEIVRSILPSKQPGDKDHQSVKAWIEAKGDYQALLTFRRRVAHQPVQFREGEVYTILTAPDLYAMPDLLGTPPWLEIATSEHEALREKPPGQPITVEHLLAHKVSVVRLRDRLNRFYSGVLTKHPGGASSPAPPRSRD